MKVIICLFLMLMSISTLFSQSVDLELKMHPEINKLEFNNDPRILLLETFKRGFILFDPFECSLIETNESNLVFAGEKTIGYTDFFGIPIRSHHICTVPIIIQPMKTPVVGKN